jgi:hypothetical protein
LQQTINSICRFITRTGKVINFSEILGNVPKFWDSSLKFWDSVPIFIWKIFRPPTDLWALILLLSKEHDKRTFPVLVYYLLELCQQGPLLYNSKISSYNLPTDRLDAGRPLKHGLPVKPPAISTDDDDDISRESASEASDDD